MANGWSSCTLRVRTHEMTLRSAALWLGRKTKTFSGTNQKPKRPRPFVTGLVRHCSQGLFSPFFTFLRAIFSARFDFLFSPLYAPGSPRIVRKAYVERLCSLCRNGARVTLIWVLEPGQSVRSEKKGAAEVFKHGGKTFIAPFSALLSLFLRG